ncbi:MMPL family transporter [Acetobacter sp. AN02]|uniref:MMPL family transporter n=1 Tax=Acetobacter sp. AN02 TaxID=2894186 RepID=UPI002434610C|nr:MMPL family transporter [Acetobacter sp. AN02]MDG6095332.1 MMPL family transporter [Acetobacter sp. AN02]
MLAAIIGRFIVSCARHAWTVVLIFTLLAAGSVWAAMKHLDVTTDTDRMLSDTLGWKQRSNEMGRLFPQKQDLMVAVIDADLPEEARETARQLGARLAGDHAHFNYVRLPDDNPYLTRNGLMFLKTKQLEKVLNDTITAQPFLGALAADPSARGLFDSLGLIAQGVKAGQADLNGFAGPLNGFSRALSLAASGKPEPLSWQQLLGGGLSDLAGRYTFVITQPRPDYSSFQPGGDAAKAIRNAANDLEFVKSGQAHVSITGDVQISDEEFATVAEGMVAGLIGSLLLVTLWLFLAVRSWRVIVPIVLTLVTGLLLTTGFAAVAVGTLNLISVAFAILFVGIAVDFAIQFSVRFLAQPHSSDDPAQDTQTALHLTGEETGHQILVAAAATAAGFLAFVPTDFLGVAQLGLIAGMGMLVAFICTIGLLPALLYLMKPQIDQKRAGFAWLKPGDVLVRRYRRPVIGVFAVLALAGVALMPKLTFDGDPLHTKDPHSEGMRTLHLLMENPISSPYSAEFLVKDKEQAQALAQKTGGLPGVHDAMWLGSYVPEDQKAKLPLIQDAASMLLSTLIVDTPQAAPDAAALRASAAKAASRLGEVLGALPGDSPLRSIQASLAKLSVGSDDLVMRMNRDLVRFLPMQLDTLKLMLGAGPVTLSDVPGEIRRDYVAPDGRYLVEVHPQRVESSAQLGRFVREMQAVSPQVAGSATDIVESARTIVHAFVVAALSAVVMIAIILAVALRRLLDAALVIAPLLLSALMTVILIVCVPETLNFANIIALPLLLGVGVSFNIYFVMNWRAGVRFPLASPTARAVLFSALTTGTAFGSLALSHHPGTASMGRLLLLSLGCTLLATLVFVPALLPKRAADEI